jgi:ribosomal protein S18 acetylase RimI-like enzyme
LPDPAVGQVVLLRNGEPPPPPPLPARFTVRPLAGPAEAGAVAALHRAAFGTANMTAAWRARVLARPEYRPGLDLVVIAPDQRLAATCLAWLDPAAPGGARGQIEPLGVHPDFQRRGIGRAILAAVLRALHAQGATGGSVITDDVRDGPRALYELAGFRVDHRIVVCRREFGG